VFWWWACTLVLLATGQQIASEGVDIYSMATFGLVVSCTGSACALRFHQQLFFASVLYYSPA